MEESHEPGSWTRSGREQHLTTRQASPKLSRAKARKVPKMPSAFKPIKGPKRWPKLPKVPGIKPVSGPPRTKGLSKFPGPQSSDSSDRDEELGPDDPTVVALIERALDERLQIAATYWGKDGEGYHEFLPLALGSKNGHGRLWSYQVIGASGAGWRCFRIAGLKDLQMKQGSWDIPASDPGPAKCVNLEEGARYVRGSQSS